MQRVSESDRSRVALFGRSRTPRWRERPPVASRHPTQPDARTHARTLPIPVYTWHSTFGTHHHSRQYRGGHRISGKRAAPVRWELLAGGPLYIHQWPVQPWPVGGPFPFPLYRVTTTTTNTTAAAITGREGGRTDLLGGRLRLGRRGLLRGALLGRSLCGKRKRAMCQQVSAPRRTGG